MTKLQKTLKSFGVHIFYFLGIPAFLLVFVIVFHPEDITALLSAPPAWSLQSSISIIFAILLGSMILSRVLFFLLRNDISSFNWYLVWNIMEFLIGCAFVSLFICLINKPHLPYLDTLIKITVHLFSILIMPYSLLTGYVLLYDERHHREFPENPDDRIKFYDTNHLLKLTVSASSILYIEADENYVNIYYVENGRLKHHTLRSSMKSIESLCQSRGIHRCHRSFFVNTSHIKVLRRDKEGIIYIELDNAEAKQIPVSKKYYDAITGTL